MTGTTATLTASLACGDNGNREGNCYWYWEWGTANQYQYHSQTWGPVGTTCGDGCKVAVTYSLYALAPHTTYHFQVCGKGDGVTQFICVGPTGGTPGTFTTTGTARPLPAVTTAGLHLFEPFNQNEQVVNGQAQGEAGVLDYVWGASQPANGIPVWHDAYTPYPLDPAWNDVAWWKANHPTWLLYKSDRTTPAVNSGQSAPFLDFTNPQVQQYIASVASGALGKGFNGIGWDPAINNSAGAAGHYDASGNWVQQYDGTYYDPVYAEASAAGLAAIITIVRQRYPATSDALNDRFECNTSRQPVAVNASDIDIDEGSFTSNTVGTHLTTEAGYGCASWWLDTVNGYIQLQADAGGDHAVALINSESYTVTPYMTDTNMKARADLQYGMANYFLIKEAHTYFSWGPAGNSGYGGPPVPQHEYTTANAIGEPAGEYYSSQGVYMRGYTNGLTIVNPDPTRTFTISLRSGYHDLYGTSVNSLTLGPASGEVLLGN